MLRQIRRLTLLELSNLYGINVFRHTKDKIAKKKSIAMAAIIGVIILVLMGYVCGLCLGLSILGATDIIPTYLIVISSILTLMISIFKTGNIIFRKQGYEIMSALPVSERAVVCSRFIRLYVENLVLVLIIMIPGMIVYSILAIPNISFYLIAVLSILIVPLFPVTLASAIGALIVGISSRTKHKALVEAGLIVILVVGGLIGTVNLPKTDNDATMEMLQNLEQIVTEGISKVYPPAIWLGDAMVQTKWSLLGITAVIFLVVFCAVVAIVGCNFHKISRSLYGTTAKHNYEMEHLQKNGIMKALVIREARRYFSSGVYVANTIVGPIMGTVMSLAFVFIDLEELTKSLPMSMNINAAIPFGVAAVFAMMNAASVSISMEGKEVWLLKSLPLDRKTIINSKILFNLCIYAPFYFVSVIGIIIAFKPSISDAMGIIVSIAIGILFAVVWGIMANLLLPKMNWENEVEVVKQSASSALGGIGATIVILICAVLVLLVPATYAGIASVCAIVLLLVIAGVIYFQKLVNVDIKEKKC